MKNVMNRRDSVLATLAVSTGTNPLSVSAQAHPVRGPMRIGLVPDQVIGPWHQLFIDDLRNRGRIQGRDYVFIHSGVPSGPDSQSALERVLEAKPDLLLTCNLAYAVAAHKVSKTLPIVMMISGFPVAGGVADSLTRPGRNVTGMTIYAGPEVFGKLVQLLHEVKPGAKRIGVFMSYVPPANPRAEADVINRGFRSAAAPLGLDVRIFEIGKPEQVDDAMVWAGAQGVEALVLTGGISVAPRMKDILQFAVAKRLPAITRTPRHFRRCIGKWRPMSIRSSGRASTRVICQFNCPRGSNSWSQDGRGDRDHGSAVDPGAGRRGD